MPRTSTASGRTAARASASSFVLHQISHGSLGSAFTKVASGGGGVGRGTATAGAFREPRFAGAQNDVTFRSIFPGTGGNVRSKPAFAPTFVLIGEKDPQVQRQLAGIVRGAWERGIR